MTFEEEPESHSDEDASEVDVDARAETIGTSAESGHTPGRNGIGSMIGPYRLLQLIGEGGMGEVWLAEQKEPVRRRVAIKLIKAGMDTQEVVARFASERQALALMDHPAIAKVFDAGSTLEGRPYFVMEYVAGKPITAYCDRHKLDISQRLKLFIAVCEGVQHAHQKAIIHRDLKPSNILVTEVDGKPVPRIIDFGVAKATSQRLNAGTLYTQVGAMIGTLGYMSPEQADSGGEDIDTRSDVYSLGVVLYELLSGTLPFDFRKLAFDEVLRRLREEDAPSPSTRLRTLGGKSETIAKNHGADSPTLVSILKGDPDAITLKALEKDRNRRYATPLELASDIGRYLRNEPVLAHAPSTLYRASKYIRRHRVGVSLASLLVLLLTSFAIAQSVELRRIRLERDRADRITDFITDMFKVSSPSEARGNAVTAREILDKSSREIETGLGQDADVRLSLMQVMSKTYQNLGLYTQAKELTNRILSDPHTAKDPESLQALEAMTQMGWILYQQGHDQEAEELIRKTIDIESRVLGRNHTLTLQSRDHLAWVLIRQAHYSDVEKMERDIVDVSSRTFGPEDARTLQYKDSLAISLARQSKFSEAEAIYSKQLEVERRTLGPDHPATLASMHDLANTLSEQGNYAAAEQLYKETLDIETRVLGPEHPDTVSTMTTLANTIRFRSGRRLEAEELYRKALAINIRIVGKDHPNTTRSEEGLANVLSEERRYPEAETLLREVLAVRQRTLGTSHTDTLITEFNLAAVESHELHYAEAEKLARETLSEQSRVLDADDADTMASRALLASILLAQNKAEEAARLAHKAFNDQLRTLGPEHRDTLESLGYLGNALVKTGRYDDAKKIYLDMIEQVNRKEAKTSPALYGLWYDLGCLAALAGRKDDAIEDLRHSIDAGYDDASSMRADEDLKSLRLDARFLNLVKQIKPLSR